MDREQMKQLRIPFAQITDGVTDAGELHSLSELGVTSISLNATTTTTYEDQNAITHTSTFTQQTTDAEGNTITETNAVNDVWFIDELQRKAIA